MIIQTNFQPGLLPLQLFTRSLSLDGGSGRNSRMKPKQCMHMCIICDCIIFNLCRHILNKILTKENAVSVVRYTFFLPHLKRKKRNILVFWCSADTHSPKDFLNLSLIVLPLHSKHDFIVWWLNSDHRPH